jgi:hypothetical protein
MTEKSFLKWLNVLAFMAVIIVNGLAASTTLIGGKNTAQISDKNPTLITPAGYVFFNMECYLHSIGDLCCLPAIAG